MVICVTDIKLSLIAPAVNSTFDKQSRIIEKHTTDHTKVVFNGSNYIAITIGNNVYILDRDVNISSVTDLDTGSIQAGKDYYIYACDTGLSVVFKVSLNSTNPLGYTTTTSRKIGGFHTLCVGAGTISGHPLSGYIATDILPQSVWDLRFRARCNSNAGMVYDPYVNKWADIYVPSDDGNSGAQSVYNATILDSLDWMTFVDRGAKVGKRLLEDHEFQSIAAGSNEETNIAGSADPVTTGGHVDTAGRRMISNIGCEDCAGAMWQWLLTQSYRAEGQIEDSSAGYYWYDLPGAKGSSYRQGTYGDVKLLAGGSWNSGSHGGSRSRISAHYRWDSWSAIGSRLCAEPL